MAPPTIISQLIAKYKFCDNCVYHLIDFESSKKGNFKLKQKIKVQKPMKKERVPKMTPKKVAKIVETFVGEREIAEQLAKMKKLQVVLHRHPFGSQTIEQPNALQVLKVLFLWPTTFYFNCIILL